MNTEEVFYYDEERLNIASLTKVHSEEGDIGALAEAHPNVIYFYAEFGPVKEWDFNDYPPVMYYSTMHDATLDEQIEDLRRRLTKGIVPSADLRKRLRKE